MGKGISKRHEIVFRNEYKKWLHKLCDELIDYRENMITIMKDTVLKSFRDDSDFKEMAMDAIFHKIQVIYDQEAAVEETNNIIHSDIEDDDE